MVMFPTDPAQAAVWLAERRWYGDKSRTIMAVESTSHATIRIGDIEVVLTSVDLAYEDGGTATYFVPLHIGPNDEVLESLTLPAFQAWIADGFGENRRLATVNDSELAWHRSRIDVLPWWEGEPSPLQGEQSNTSICYGDAAIIKVFRKWQVGINPDTEIVEFLTEQTPYRHVPTYLGSIRLAKDDAMVEVAAVQNFIPNDGDSWRWLPSVLQALPVDQESELLAEIRLLGQRTGELHVALASGGEEAFAPEAFDSDEVHATRQRIRTELDHTAAMLERGGHLSSAEVAALCKGLETRLRNASSLVGTKRTRVHGDYHLGQVLRSQNDFVIIDFEGEPSRSMAERRQKHSPMKDVAGMLRSLDYAVASAAQSVAPADHDRLVDLGDRMTAAFLDGYREALSQGAIELLPASDDAFTAALDLFMIEKALYEARYEMDNRPDWLEIPLGALQRVASASQLT